MRTWLAFLTILALAAPASAQEIHSFGYARLGYGGVFADRPHGAPAIGVGYRGELDSFALDVSFLNFVVGASPYGDAAFAGSLLRLQGLRFVSPGANRSAYFGGGLSWGSVDAERRNEQALTTYVSGWHGSGLQGEVTAGYELARRSPMRVFVQADIGLPVFYARSETTSRTAPSRVVEAATAAKRYIPSAALSVGLGWNHR